MKVNYCVDCVFHEREMFHKVDYCYFENFKHYHNVTKKIDKTDYCNPKMCKEYRGKGVSACLDYKRKWWKFWVSK